VFYLHVLGEVLAYQVFYREPVPPHDTTRLGITQGKDYCTLITCYPTGVNTHRLLVQGERIPYEEAEVIEEAVQLETVPESRWEEQYLLGIGLGVLGMLAAALICGAIMVCRKYRKGGRNAREKEPQSR
jgi:sortase A